MHGIEVGLNAYITRYKSGLCCWGLPAGGVTYKHWKVEFGGHEEVGEEYWKYIKWVLTVSQHLLQYTCQQVIDAMGEHLLKGSWNKTNSINIKLTIHISVVIAMKNNNSKKTNYG